jgi:UDP-N-acetylmuramoyl-tripeptide--D-alanyl-D-alanine ligase
VSAGRAAVTGSVGKTSVVQALAAALARSGPCHASVKSYNNHIGVPLTLARMPADSRFGVFEVGMNHAGEIGPLSRMIEPEVAVVTTVGPAHIENFSDGEAGVARAKAEIFEGLQPRGAAVLNHDAPYYQTLAQAAQTAGAEILRFGRGAACEGRLLGVEISAGGLQVEAELRGRRLSYRLPQSGVHGGHNSLATLLAAEVLGADVPAAVGALEGFAPLAGRGERRRLDLSGRSVVLIDESYNANPLSMRAALGALASEPSGRRVAILTDMLEMGERSEELHRGLAEPLIEAGVTAVFLAGPGMRALHDAVCGSVASVWRESAEALEPLALAGLEDGDVVMVKGSNGSSASRLAQALSAAASAPARETD